MTQAITSLQARLSACRGVLVDSNVLLDVATNDPGWGDYAYGSVSPSAAQVEQCRLWLSVSGRFAVLAGGSVDSRTRSSG